jgi:hypothetical protein
MKTTRKLPSVFAAMALVLLCANVPVSCASTGNFIPLENGETVLGTIQTAFVARDTVNGRDAINTLAYIKLLEAAQGQYARDGVQIDIRDIIWTSGKKFDSTNTEYSAAGKVVRLP